MEDIKIDDERERHRKMVFEENDGGVDDRKALLHDKRWYVYMNQKENIIKGGYLVEVLGHDENKVIWEVVENYVVEEATDHDEIGLQGFNFNFSDKEEKGGGREWSRKSTYLIIPIKIWPGYCKTQFKKMNQMVNAYNGKAIVIWSGRYRKVCRFPRN